VLTFSENVQAGSGNITISDGSDSRVIDVTDGTQVTISGNQVTIDPTTDLNFASAYNVQIDSGALTDTAGNEYAGIGDDTTLNFDTAPDPSVVVFDLVNGASSDHSGRTFESDVSYDIYILVDSNDSALDSTGGNWSSWSGASNLGSDDRVILVGTGGAGVEGPAGTTGLVTQVSVDTTAAAVAWQTGTGTDVTAGLLQGQTFSRFTGTGTDNAVLFDTTLPAAFFNGQGGLTATMYLTAMPAGILTSQGLV
jgi:hypothetical protein